MKWNGVDFTQGNSLFRAVEILFQTLGDSPDWFLYYWWGMTHVCNVNYRNAMTLERCLVIAFGKIKHWLSGTVCSMTWQGLLTQCQSMVVMPLYYVIQIKHYRLLVVHYLPPKFVSQWLNLDCYDLIYFDVLFLIPKIWNENIHKLIVIYRWEMFLYLLEECHIAYHKSINRAHEYGIELFMYFRMCTIYSLVVCLRIASLCQVRHVTKRY